jgi:acyl-CoA synthetase (NDP forming)
MNSSFWDALFAPQSIAVIGANDTMGTWGSDAVRSALAFAKDSPGKRAYAVNPNQAQIMGQPAFKTVLDIPDPVDLAIIVVRANIVPQVMEDCVRKGVRAAVIISAGFSETDAEGAALEREVVRIARTGGIRLVGPNFVGHADLYSRASALGVVGRTRPGPLAILGQSGTLSSSIIGAAAMLGIGLSKFVSTGNEADLHMEDYLEYLAADEKTRVIAAYIEGLREARRFFEIAKRTTRKKPIVVIKTGSTNGSTKAARSHTGALAGSDAVYSAAFRQSGVIRVSDEEELADVALALLNSPLPRNNRVGILTIGGGFGVMATEACEKEGLVMSTLGQRTLSRLDEVLPPRWSHGNPVDMVGVKSLGEFPTILSCLETLIEDPNTDSILGLVAIRNYAGEQFKAVADETEKRISDLAKRASQAGKPFFLARRALGPQAGNGEWPSAESTERIPEYGSAKRAARVLGHLIRRRQYLEG